MPLFLTFDTETTGIPNWNIPSDDPSQPHMVSVAALIVDDESFEIQEQLDLVVAPDGWEWDESCEAYQTHGISVDHAKEFGVPEKDAMLAVIEMWEKCEYRVAHNTTFDNRIIRIAMKRYGVNEVLMDAWKDKSGYKCTGNLSRNILKLPPKGRFGYKMPKLSEAYEYFTGEELEGAHNAMADTMACLVVYKGVQNHKPTKEQQERDKQEERATMGLEDIFNFGKHKAQQLEDVVIDHPDYIKWLVENSVVGFDNEAMELINKLGIL